MKMRILERAGAVRRSIGRFAAGLLLALPALGSAQLVTGLQGASGSAIGPDGALYVTEGAIGQLTRIDPVTGETTAVASGLPPSLPFVGIGGAIDVAFLDGTAYVLVTLVGEPAFGTPYRDGIYRVESASSFELIADLGAWSAANLPDTSFFLENGVQYAIDAFRGGFLVSDGHHNRVLEVRLDGSVSEFATFSNTVPTGLEVHGNTVYMAEAGPVWHLPEDGKLIAIDAKTGASTELASGARLAVDVERGLGRSLYLLSQGFWVPPNPDVSAEEQAGAPPLENTGSIYRVNPNGTVTQVGPSALNRPTSLEFIGGTAYVVTMAGEVWALPNLSSPPFGKNK